MSQRHLTLGRCYGEPDPWWVGVIKWSFFLSLFLGIGVAAVVVADWWGSL